MIRRRSMLGVGSDARQSVGGALQVRVPASLGAGALLLFAGLLSGCGDAGVVPSATDDGANAPLIARASAAPSFVVEMEGALEGTWFLGTRVAWSRQVISPVGASRFQAKGAVVQTRQLVASDGDGSYAIELVDALELPPAVDPMNFAVSFERSVDAQWRLREFRVRSFDAMLANYAVRVLDGGDVVAGIQCERVEFVRYNPFEDRPGHYAVDVDPSTGFTLGMVEFDFDGQPLASFRYESFAYAPDLSGVQLRSGAYPSTELDLSVDFVFQNGFQGLFPDLYPEGFELLSAASITVPAASGTGGPMGATGSDSFLPSGEWLRLVASDGIEAIAFAHAEADQVLDVTANTAVLRVLEEGTWRIAFGQIRGVALICSGRIGHEPLRRLVESAF